MTMPYPLAQYRPLEKTQGQPKMQRHDIVCLHTMVGNLSGTDRMFKANGWGGTESHFGIGGKWSDGLDGVVYQWQDTDYQADANLDGNRRIISIETGDNAPRLPKDIEPWTERQLDAIVTLTAYLCRTYDIPAVLIEDSGPGRRGIGYHRLGVPGFAKPGTEIWSTSRGKECPGPARIAQMAGIVARVKAVLTRGEDPMLDLSSTHKLTASDAEAYGGNSKIGDTKAYEEMLRFPPAVQRLRREVADDLSGVLGEVLNLRKDVENLSKIATQQAVLITQLITKLSTK